MAWPSGLLEGLSVELLRTMANFQFLKVDYPMLSLGLRMPDLLFILLNLKFSMGSKRNKGITEATSLNINLL
jgi:hypothetical protein